MCAFSCAVYIRNALDNGFLFINRGLKALYALEGFLFALSPGLLLMISGQRQIPGFPTKQRSSKDRNNGS